MKKIILFAVLGILLASCSKSSTGLPANTITATINDTNYIFNTNIIDTSVYSNGTLLLELSATDLNLNKAVLAIESTTTLTATAYGGLSGDTTNEAVFGILLPNTTQYSSGFPPSASNPITITVSSLTSTSIQGTFKGTIFFNGDTTSTSKKTVTNGTFSFTKPAATFQ
jgi:hypothetical protein